MTGPTKKAFWAAGLLLASGIAPFIVFSNNSKVHPPLPNPVSKEITRSPANTDGREPLKSAIQSEDRAAIRMINLTVYERGIYPRKIKVQPGHIMFSIDDRYGYASGLIISGAGHQHQIPKPAARRRWKGTIRLDVGTFVISDARRPDIRSDLVVSP
jgi:hypothetical protein